MTEAATVPREQPRTEQPDRTGVILVGQPNVGKSALSAR